MPFFCWNFQSVELYFFIAHFIAHIAAKIILLLIGT